MQSANATSRMKVIDAHAHIFPEKIAEKATESIGEFYGMKMSGEGSSRRLIAEGEKIGVSRYLVCSTATRPAQVPAINQFIADECEKHPEFVGLGTVHQDTADKLSELETIRSYGLVGLKLHADFQGVNIDDQRYFPVYAYCERAGMPILFHCGDDRTDFSHPRRVYAVCERYPGLNVIAAHLGGYTVWAEGIRILLECANVYTDTCSSLALLEPAFAVELIRAFGVDRVFFAVDFPMWLHSEEWERFQRLGLTEQEQRKICSENLERLIPAFAR